MGRAFEQPAGRKIAAQCARTVRPHWEKDGPSYAPFRRWQTPSAWLRQERKVYRKSPPRADMLRLYRTAPGRASTV
jgi:hypothetical protein